MSKVKLGDLALKISSGLTPSRTNPKYWINGIIDWVKTEQIGQKYVYSSNEKITNFAFKNTSIKINPINTLSIAMYGEGKTRGSVSILKVETTTNQACCNIIVDEEKADTEFLYYKLKTQYEKLRSLSSGVRKNLNSNDIKEFEISIPNLHNQQKIASVLSALDDKIELNNKINAELEAMVKTLYDYWFAQFEFPNVEGKPYKSSGGKMIYNGTLKREIPDGWEVKSLEELGNFKNGVNYNPSNPGKIPCSIINVRNISNSSFFLKNTDLDIIYLEENDVRKYSVDENSIIIARSGIPGAARLISDYAPNTLYCGFAIRYQLENTSLKNLVFFYLKSIEENIKNGSGGTIMKNVNQATLNNLKTIMPTDNILMKFNSLINPIFKKISNIEKQNQELAQLRDWLLPMLMNGQVKVVDDLEVNSEPLAMVAEPALVYSSSAEKTTAWYDQRFELWVDQQGLAARGTIDKATLRELFDAMNDEDK